MSDCCIDLNAEIERVKLTHTAKWYLLTEAVELVRLLRPFITGTDRSYNGNLRTRVNSFLEAMDAPAFAEIVGYDPDRTPEGCACSCHRGVVTAGRCCLHMPIIEKRIRVGSGP